LALILLAAVLFAGLLVWTVRDVTQVDARIPVDGRPHQVTVPSDGDRMIFADASGNRRPCRVTDSSGREIQQRDLFGDLTVSRNGREWSGLTRFDPGDGEIVVSCRPGPMGLRGDPTIGSEVLITPAHDVGGVVARVMATIGLPLIIGGIGLFWGLVLVILMLTRRR
jgi:hypothetical protein